MIDLSNALATFVQNAHGWAYLLVLLGALTEALPVIGILIPGQTIVIIAGALLVSSNLSITLLILLASCGAIIGDGISFVIGWRYGTGFLHHRSAFIRRAAQESRKFFDKYGAFSIIIGRFNSLTRAFVPVFAGSTRMRQSRFWASNIIGGVLWSMTMLFIGFALGHGYRLLYKQVGAYTIIAIAVLFACWYAYKRVIKRLFEEHPRKMLFALTAGSMMVFVMLLDAVTDVDSWLSPAVLRMDTTIHSFSSLLQHSTPFWNVVTTLGGASAIIAVLIIGTVHLRRRREDAKLLLFSAAIGFWLDVILKGAIARTRPDITLHTIGYSFPSGHTVMATVVYGSLAVIFWRSLRAAKAAEWKQLTVWLLPLIALLVGVSRLALDVHWASDVIAGFALGIAVISGVLFTQHFRQDIRREG